MAAFGWTVLVLLFVDELLAIAAMADWGAHRSGVVLAAGLAIVTMLVWFLFASPKARYGGGPVRPVVKVLVFALATAALWYAGHESLAVWFLAFSVVVNGLAQVPAIRELPAQGFDTLGRGFVPQPRSLLNHHRSRSLRAREPR